MNQKRIDKWTITDNKVIRKMLCAPDVMPDSFLPKKLVPIGMAKFKGFDRPFTKNKLYPIYVEEGTVFVVNELLLSNKFEGGNWGEIINF